MSRHPSNLRALTLFSGSLDSQRAYHLLKRQRISQEVLLFTYPLLDIDRARKAAARCGALPRMVDITADALELLNGTSTPVARLSAALRGRMLLHAHAFARGEHTAFVCTGEVLLQTRPGQSMETFEVLARESGWERRILRPLSARRLPPTHPEHEGWVNRHLLLDQEGADRAPQERWAAEEGIGERSPLQSWWEDETFMARVEEARRHGGVAGHRQMELLRRGRHFRLSRGARLVVARHEQENLFLRGTTVREERLLTVEGARAPLAVLPVLAEADEQAEAAAILLRYSKAPAEAPMMVRFSNEQGEHKMTARRAEEDVVNRLRIG